MIFKFYVLKLPLQRKNNYLKHKHFFCELFSRRDELLNFENQRNNSSFIEKKIKT